MDIANDMVTKRLPLPVDAILPELLSTLQNGNSAVLQASPGSGKTTRVPPALLDAAFAAGPRSRILVLEPRRLAAKLSAARVADELGVKVGDLVGYQFRFENVTSKATRLTFLTEGMLMRRMLSDPELRDVSAVVLDEFHERHLHGDIALGYLRFLQRTKRPDLRLVVMSATLDTGALCEFLGEAPLITVESRVHPVEVEYLPGPPSKPLEALVREAVMKTIGTDGDILVFLPGMAEIRRAEAELRPLGETRGFLIAPLHGELSREAQDFAVTRSSDGRRKVILSTNVAETSLTIEGVTTVIDSGLHRQASYSWWSGVPTLRTRAISKASAIQRAGRAGRTGPGRCLRLYARGDFDSRAPFDVPEIRRADLAQTVLELKALGIHRLSEFPWFEAPAPTALAASENLLALLGALEGAGGSGDARLSALGKKIAEIPVHPRLARMLLEAAGRGALDEAATLATWIAEGELGFSGPDALAELARERKSDFRLDRVRRQILSSFSSETSEERRGGGEARKDAVALSVLAGFPDRVARKRALPAARSRSARGPQVELLFCSGGASAMDEGGVLSEGDLFVAIDAIEKGGGPGQNRTFLQVRSVVPVREEWLLDFDAGGSSLLLEKDELRWDSERKRVERVSSLSYGEIVLSETRKDPSAEQAGQAAALLAKEALGIHLASISGDSLAGVLASLARVADGEALESLFGRLSLIEKNASRLKVSFSMEALGPVIADVFSGKSRQSELVETDWVSEILVRLDPDIAARLDSWLPSHLSLPSGRRAKIHYDREKDPWLESRLQDFFGMRQGPAILGGVIPLTLHLLAPNQRAVQVTRDLEGFWKRAYPELRRQLMRRYPRHAWPEDPLRGPT